MAVFAGLAAVISALGLGAVLAFAVRRRRSEIGVRGALGATPGQILRLFLHRGLVLVGCGIGLGLVAALALGRFLGGLLFGVGPADPWALAAAVLAALVVATPAIWIPARRAVAVDPARVLREE
jgi:ABC-type antimicrobial peptide transport system permease subunit